MARTVLEGLDGTHDHLCGEAINTFILLEVDCLPRFVRNQKPFIVLSADLSPKLDTVGYLDVNHLFVYLLRDERENSAREEKKAVL